MIGGCGHRILSLRRASPESLTPPGALSYACAAASGDEAETYGSGLLFCVIIIPVSVYKEVKTCRQRRKFARRRSISRNASS